MTTSLLELLIAAKNNKKNNITSTKIVHSYQMGPNGAKGVQTVPNRVKRGQRGPNGTKSGQTGPIGPKQSKMGTKGANWDKTFLKILTVLGMVKFDYLIIKSSLHLILVVFAFFNALWH